MAGQRLNSTVCVGLTLVLLTALGGCASYPSTAPQSATRDAVSTLNRVDELQQEVRELRNLVELQQHELETLRQRQNDLYTDLDQRLTGGGPISMDLAGMEPGPDSDGTTTMPSDTPPDASASAPPTGSASIDTAAAATAATTSTANASAQDLYNAGFDALHKGRYTDSIRSFDALIARFPEDELVDDAFYWMGEASYATRDYPSALVRFETLVNRFPQSDRVPNSMLRIAYIEYDTGAYDSARRSLSELTSEFPEHDAARAAGMRLRKMDLEGL